MLVAAFAARALCADVVRTALAEHDLVIGDVMLVELRRILASKLKQPRDRIEAVEAVLATVPSVPKPAEPSVLQIRDAADRWGLAAAVAGAAHVLVTGDQDSLVVAADSAIQILDPRACWELLRTRGA